MTLPAKPRKGRRPTALLPDDPARFDRTMPHGYGDPDTVAADVAAAGFEDVSVERVVVEADPESAGEVARGFCPRGLRYAASSRPVASSLQQSSEVSRGPVACA